MKIYPHEEIKEVVQKHWVQIIEELDEYIDSRYLSLSIKLKYSYSDEEGFVYELSEPMGN